MKRIIHICLWLLTGIFAEVSLSAQNPFIYHKGKTYKDVAAYRMEEIIDLNTHTPSTPILYEQQVPEHQSTLSYKVALPLYVRGIFFSRDSRPGEDLRNVTDVNGFTLRYFLRFYRLSGEGAAFFSRPRWFDLLMGTDSVRKAILKGESEEEIRDSWQKELQTYRDMRQKYLLY